MLLQQWTGLESEFEREVKRLLRGAEETKNELHERVNDLQQSLWEISDVEREAAEEERSAVMEDSRLSDGAQLLVSYAVEMLQQEVLRFQATQSVLRDYHYSRANKPVPLETPEPLNIMDKYLGDEFAGTPLELAEDDKTL